MRGLFRWAKEAQHIAVDPTAEVTNPPKVKGPGFPVWTEDEVSQYEGYWQPGSHERVWMHVLLYTGLRRGDAVVIGRQHFKDGVATIQSEKTGEDVYIPMLPELEKTLEIGPTGDLHFVVGKMGKPLKKESFGNIFKDACKQAGIMDKSAHGLGRSEPHAQQKPEQPLQNWKRCSAGMAAQWPHITQEVRIEND